MRVPQDEQVFAFDARHRQTPNSMPMPARPTAPISARRMSSERSLSATMAGVSGVGAGARDARVGMGKSSACSATWIGCGGGRVDGRVGCVPPDVAGAYLLAQPATATLSRSVRHSFGAADAVAKVVATEQANSQRTERRNLIALIGVTPARRDVAFGSAPHRNVQVHRVRRTVLQM
jgi:hypothetical protein